MEVFQCLQYEEIKAIFNLHSRIKLWVDRCFRHRPLTINIKFFFPFCGRHSIYMRIFIQFSAFKVKVCANWNIRSFLQTMLISSGNSNQLYHTMTNKTTRKLCTSHSNANMYTYNRFSYSRVRISIWKYDKNCWGRTTSSSLKYVNPVFHFPGV